MHTASYRPNASVEPPTVCSMSQNSVRPTVETETAHCATASRRTVAKRACGVGRRLPIPTVRRREMRWPKFLHGAKPDQWGAVPSRATAPFSLAARVSLHQVASSAALLSKACGRPSLRGTSPGVYLGAPDPAARRSPRSSFSPPAAFHSALRPLLVPAR
mmetsp:Transcript_18433/g.39290  ORF Transcript_18433/g.39290 Transcript_18433/m.39290 type:complete len:160 (+) Transcript_18433:702-1181(+)